MPETTPSDPQSIINAIFKILAKSPTGIEKPGTAFLVVDKQHLLTAQHVVTNGSTVFDDITVYTDDGPLKATVLRSFVAQDVALLRVEQEINAVPLSLTGNITDSPHFTIFGYPKESTANWTPGTVRGPRPPTRDGKYEVSVTGIDPDIHLGGLSGAPVLHVVDNKPTREVVGVFIEHTRGTPLAVVSSIQPFKDFITVSHNPEDQLECLVVKSVYETQIPRTKTPLKVSVDEAIARLKADNRFTQPIVSIEIDAQDALSSPEKYYEALRWLCRAEIAIFDCSYYEPAIMLLLGIRSVVRRGVTVASIRCTIFGEEYAIGDSEDFPFNIKDVRFISHSDKQRRMPRKPRDLIYERIVTGMHESAANEYLDLPTFDSVRNLPPGRRAIVPVERGVLVMCSYGDEYNKTNWTGFITDRLALQMQLLHIENPIIERILDLTAPGLVSSTIYERLRRQGLCLVDLTEWRPNVFFELGVRTAVAPIHPKENDKRASIVIIEDKYIEVMKKIAADPDKTAQYVEELGILKPGTKVFDAVVSRFRLIAPQCLSMLKLFTHIPYACDPASDNSAWDAVLAYYTGQASSSNVVQYGAMSTQPFDIIADAFLPSIDSASIPVHRMLMLSAEILRVDSSEGLPSVLYRDNTALSVLADRNFIERYLAAWYYVTERSKKNESIFLTTPGLVEDYIHIGSTLIDFFVDSDTDFCDEIDAAIARAESIAKGNS